MTPPTAKEIVETLIQLSKHHDLEAYACLRRAAEVIAAVDALVCQGELQLSEIECGVEKDGCWTDYYAFEKNWQSALLAAHTELKKRVDKSQR